MAVRLDDPTVIGAQHAARIPSKFVRRFEGDHAARDVSAKRLPLEFVVQRKVGRIAAKELDVGAVAVPFGPLGSANQPSPNTLRRSGNRNVIVREHR